MRGWAALGTCVLTMASGCGNERRAARRAFPPCPPRRSLPAPGASEKPAHTGRVSVPARPVAAQVCTYAPRRQWSLGRAEARTLASLLAETSALYSSGEPLGCISDPEVLRLRGADGAVASFVASGCGHPLLSRGRTGRALSEPAAAAVGGLGGLRLGGAAAATPLVIGHPVGTLKAVPGASIVGEFEDRGPRFGTVVWQTPLAGSLQDRGQVQVGAVVAVHRASLCTAGQLAGRFLGGGRGTGDRFGVIALLDTSPRPCRLVGRVRVVGRGARGERVTEVLSVRPGTRNGLVLGPSGLLRATLLFNGPELSDVCRRTVVPQRWLMTVNQTEHVEFANRPVGGDDAFDSCNGWLVTHEPVQLGL